MVRPQPQSTTPLAPVARTGVLFEAFTTVVTKSQSQTVLVRLQDDHLRMRSARGLIGVEVAEISSLDATDAGVRIELRGQSIELRGSGAGMIAALLGRARPDLMAPPLVVPDHARALSSAQAFWKRDGVDLPVALIVTDQELHVVPWPPPRQGPAEVLSFSRAEAQAAVLSENRDKLTILQQGTEDYVFTGPDVVTTYYSIQHPHAPALSLPAQVSMGPLWISGRLLLSADELLHLPTGTLERFAGLKGHTIRLEDIAELSIPAKTTTVHVRHAKGKLQLQLPEARMLTSLLVRRIDSTLHERPPLPSGPEEEPEVLEEDLEADKLELFEEVEDETDVDDGGPATRRTALHKDAVLSTSGGRLTVGRAHWRYGDLVLRTHEVRFRPRRGASMGLLKIPVSVVTRQKGEARTISLKSRDRTLRFQALSTDFVERYWADARTPAQIYRPADYRSRVLRFVTGLQPLVKVWIGDELYISADNTRVRINERGIALRLPGRLRDAPEADTKLRVEVFNCNGIFEYECRLDARIAGTPNRARGERGPYHALWLPTPTAIRRYDKRAEQRIRVHAPARITRERPGIGTQTVLGLVVNLSSTGAAIRCTRSLHVGETVSVLVQLDLRELEMTAEVVRFDEAANVYGVRFIDVPGAVLQAVLGRAREKERQELAEHRTSNWA